MHQTAFFDTKVVNLLNEGCLGIGPTDTIYGILARADNELAVHRVYELKKRQPTKPCIVLVNSEKDLLEFGVPDEYVVRAKDYWPAPITLVLPTETAPEHLTRGGSNLAFRMPDSKRLRELIRKTAPLIAPSANPEGESPATTIREAKAYFGDDADFYVGSHKPVTGEPSTILQLSAQGVRQLR